MLALCGLLLAALPEAAAAQNFSADHQYNVKFVCGRADGAESRLGVVEGHYNTLINILAQRDRTALAYVAAIVSTDLIENGGAPAPSEVSRRFDLDRDGAVGILCRDIKDLLELEGPGFVEGFVTIYTTSPLAVSTVITGDDEDDESGVDVLQIIDAEKRNSSGTIRPPVPE
jgi:hypothetical protein